MGLTIITSTKLTLEVLKSQIHNLIGDKIAIRGFHLDEKIHTPISDDLILITSKSIYDDAKKYIDKKSDILIARRSINYHEISELFSIKEGSDVLLVNDLKDTANETIQLLYALGIDFITFHPYYPGITEYADCNIAVTVGEIDLVPKNINKIVDIKTRNIDFTTLVEILIKFNLMDEKANILSAKYVVDIIDLIKKKEQMMETQKNASLKFETIINTVNDGIIAYDENKEITVFNPIAEAIFNISKNNLLSNSFDTNLKKFVDDALSNSRTDKEEFIKIKDKEFIVKKRRMKYTGKYKGEVYTLKDVTEIIRLEEELRRKLVLSQHFAKYTFGDIEGSSVAIKNAKSKALKISTSDSPILIQGESGTGKELFAQAIHNSSKRKRGPFVAINFAALPDTLLDSELFGYEEGSFTGAKKGGMRGLFEQAHGGTIFLDEIGDAPVNFQIRLLRVLQEKQVRRIGANKVIPIDVRVISASNKNLKKLIQEGKFREDLYYRLNVLPFHIPSLKDRNNDIMILAYSFYKNFHPDNNIDEEQYFSKIKNAMIKYNWPGNIRELRNVVEYLINVAENTIPDEVDLPIELQNLNAMKLVKSNIDLVILENIKNYNGMNIPIGRRSLSELTGISESKVRKIINNMSANGLVDICIGRKGLQITIKGLNYLKTESL